MQTYLTHPQLYRSAASLHSEDLETCINSAREVLEWLLDESQADWVNRDTFNVAARWIDHEHSLANYGAVMCLRQHEQTGIINPLSYYFAGKQEIIRSAGWSYTRPAWCDDMSFINNHRQQLVNLRPEFYGPAFNLTPEE